MGSQCTQTSEWAKLFKALDLEVQFPLVFSVGENDHNVFHDSLGHDRCELPDDILQGSSHSRLSPIGHNHNTIDRLYFLPQASHNAFDMLFVHIDSS